MSPSGKRGRRRAVAFVSSGALIAGYLAACGEDDFKNEPRPPVTLQVTGVITDARVTISPDTFGAGPVVITVSNQTDDSHTLALSGSACEDARGERVEERVGPINPLDTATLQKTLGPGECFVRAGSAQALDREIEPAMIIVGEQRRSGKDKLLLP
jgi:hypothetical protein